MIDLHTHTTASDGALSLDELVAEGAAGGLKAIAITDHDNVGSARKISGREPLETIAGVELSVYDNAAGYQDLHVLGLFIDPKSNELQRRLDDLGRQREEQKRATVEKLNELGYSITFDEAKRHARGVVGRPHIAMALMEAYPERFASLPEVFDQLLGRGKPAFLGRERGFLLADAIKLVHGAGGLAIMAHPFHYPYDTKKLLTDFKRLGGDGVETYYDYHANRHEGDAPEGMNEDLMEGAKALAEEIGLLESGGSDFHGKRGRRLGCFGAPDAILEDLKAALHRAQA
ncbi:MAG: PHP domain-containing protein [Candidatus Micrarchaeota archaeon]